MDFRGLDHLSLADCNHACVAKVDAVPFLENFLDAVSKLVVGRYGSYVFQKAPFRFLPCTPPDYLGRGFVLSLGPIESTVGLLR